jgi:hypothetical protein
MATERGFGQMTDVIRQTGDGELTITIPRFLRRWINRIPKSLWRAMLLFFSFGVGMGLALAGMRWAASWYESRPLSPKAWPIKHFDSVGITAKLETEWNDGLQCKLIIKPSDPAKLDEFARMLSENRYNRITINLYNSTHFQIWSDDQYIRDFTRMLNHEGEAEAAVKETCLSDLSRGLYRNAASWELSSNLLPVTLNTSNNQPTSTVPTGMGSANPASQKARENHATPTPTEGDDVVSGYSVMQSNLETSGGLTFFIYKDGERDNAIEWGVQSARIHYRCEDGSLCTLTRAGTGVVLHARRRK